MPLYEYRCTQCGHAFEKIQSFSATPETVCSECGGALERPLTAPALQFKGAGWYVNDYASKSSTGKAEATKSEKAGSEGTPSSSGDAKPSDSKLATESKSSAGDSASKPVPSPTPSSTT